MHKLWRGQSKPCQNRNMSVNWPYGKPRPERVDGRLYLTDENLDRGALTVIAAARRLELRLRSHPALEGLSPPQMSILLELHHAPGISVTDLRTRLGGTIPTIARLLGELERKELIARPRNVSDGRQRALVLSSDGKAKIDAALAGLRRDLTGVYRSAGEPSVSGALDLLEAIAAMPDGGVKE